MADTTAKVDVLRGNVIRLRRLLILADGAPDSEVRKRLRDAVAIARTMEPLPTANKCAGCKYLNVEMTRPPMAWCRAEGGHDISYDADDGWVPDEDCTDWEADR